MTIAVHVNSHIYLDLAHQLRKHGDLRPPEAIVAVALREWQDRHLGRKPSRGFEDDLIIYQGESVTPHSWLLQVSGTVHNAWRDIWMQRNYRECWTPASAWRASAGAEARRPGIDRRLRQRRCGD